MVLPLVVACGALGPAPELEGDLSPAQDSETAETRADGAIAGLYSTLGDLYQYDQALFTGALIGPDLLAEMFTSGSLNDGEETGYGLGVEVAIYGGYDYVGHQGSWLSFDTYYLHLPAEDLSVVVLLNLEEAEPDTEAIANAIADLYIVP